MTAYRFLEPLDVLHFRGNRLFGESGGGGENLMPPWPSVFAGALRSQMLTDGGVHPAAYGAGAALDGPLAESLGTPASPGSFTIESLTLGRRDAQGIEAVHPLPADIQVFAEDDTVGHPEVHALQPQAMPPGMAASIPVPEAAVLRRAQRGKPRGGYWLTSRGWQRYIRGEALTGDDLIHQSSLWRTERRLGIELDRERRSTVEGQLYTTDALRLSQQPATGFLVGVSGVAEDTLPGDGIVRLGGDGRGAALHTARDVATAEPDLPAMEETGCFRLVLTTPGIFPAGWRPPGLADDGTWSVDGLRARLVSAAIPRGGVISGWDLANRHPKPAQRIVPTGAVYWFELLDGDTQPLRKLASTGLWGLSTDNDDPMRRAEGFNRFAVANA